MDFSNNDPWYWKEKYRSLLDAVRKKFHTNSLQGSSAPASAGDVSPRSVSPGSHASQTNIVGHYGGFQEEYGVENPSPEVSLLFQHCNYKNWFYHQGEPPHRDITV